MSQGYCESRDIIYDPRAKSVLSVFYFLIKKELMLQRVVCILCHAGWGESIYKMKKAIYNLKK